MKNKLSFIILAIEIDSIVKMNLRFNLYKRYIYIYGLNFFEKTDYIWRIIPRISIFYANFLIFDILNDFFNINI